jgi:hypothetical protein
MEMRNTLPENALILVAVMPSPKDMEFARVLGWYRIPLRMAPKIIDVDYLVFYQTGKFPQGHRSIIETYAEVKGFELTTRAELIRNEPEHPKSGEEYYKIYLGRMGNIHPPVVTENWKRITFFYSIGQLVNNARIVNDLVVGSDDREILWKTIREKSQKKYSETEKGFSGISDIELMTLLRQVINLNSELKLDFSGFKLDK